MNNLHSTTTIFSDKMYSTQCGLERYIEVCSMNTTNPGSTCGNFKNIQRILKFPTKSSNFEMFKSLTLATDMVDTTLIDLRKHWKPKMKKDHQEMNMYSPC